MLDYAASSTLKNPIYADSCCFYSESSESFIKEEGMSRGKRCKTHFLVLLWGMRFLMQERHSDCKLPVCVWYQSNCSFSWMPQRSTTSWCLKLLTYVSLISSMGTSLPTWHVVCCLLTSDLWPSDCRVLLHNAALSVQKPKQGEELLHFVSNACNNPEQTGRAIAC